MTTHTREQDSAASHLCVSVACFRWNGESIETLVADDLSLPSAVPTNTESLNTTAERIISTHVAVAAAYTEQLYTFDTVAGATRETIVTYIAMFPPEAESEQRWLPPAELPALPVRTAEMLEYAFVRLRAKLEYTSIAFHLMPATFTLASLQTAYESILGAPLDKRNFRRRMIASGMLVSTGEKRREGPHRPAELFRFSGQADRSSYLTPSSTSPGWRETAP